MDGNPYTPPTAPVGLPADDEARRHAAARRLGKRALMLVAGGFLVGGLCVIPFSHEFDDATRVRHWWLFVALLAVALIAQLIMLTGVVIGLLAVVRGALRRRPGLSADRAAGSSTPA